MTPRRRTVARRLWAGSGVLTRRAAGGAAAWVRAGRRTDIRGLRAVLGPLLRAGVLLGGAYAAARTVRAAPAVLWPLAGAWCAVAYRAASTPQQAAAAPDPAPLDPQAAFARWLLATIGDRPGIHLRDLYPAMRQLPGQEGRDDATLRASLRTLGIPVDRSIRVGGVAGRSGSYRHKVAALLSPTESGPGGGHGDAGQTADSPLLSPAGERVESA